MLNSDSQINPEYNLGNNAFAYCQNDPINAVDKNGEWPSWNSLKKGIVKAINKALNTANVLMSKQRTLRPDTGLQGIPPDEISRRARDKSLPGKERKRYQTEEKLNQDGINRKEIVR